MPLGGARELLLKRALSTSRGPRGVSRQEFLVTLLIVSTMVGLAIPNVLPVVRVSQLRFQVDSLETFLGLARRRAQERRSEVRIRETLEGLVAEVREQSGPTGARPFLARSEPVCSGRRPG